MPCASEDVALTDKEEFDSEEGMDVCQWHRTSKPLAVSLGVRHMRTLQEAQLKLSGVLCLHSSLLVFYEQKRLRNMGFNSSCTCVV